MCMCTVYVCIRALTPHLPAAMRAPPADRTAVRGSTVRHIDGLARGMLYATHALAGPGSPHACRMCTNLSHSPHER